MIGYYTIITAWCAVYDNIYTYCTENGDVTTFKCLTALDILEQSDARESFSIEKSSVTFTEDKRRARKTGEKLITTQRGEEEKQNDRLKYLTFTLDAISHYYFRVRVRRTFCDFCLLFFFFLLLKF